MQAQEDELPVFKRVTHPFMPSITSEYFFFSEDGLLWFSTARGLTSFDGSDIIYHSTLQQSNSFVLSRVLAMAEDKQHNFYIGTPVGFFHYDRTKKIFTPFTYTFYDNNKQPNIGFDALYYDDKGFLYAGSALNGLFIYDELKKQLSHYNLDPARPESVPRRDTRAAG